MLITEQYPETLENSPGTLAEFLGSDIKGKHLTIEHWSQCRNENIGVFHIEPKESTSRWKWVILNLKQYRHLGIYFMLLNANI